MHPFTAGQYKESVFLNPFDGLKFPNISYILRKSSSVLVMSRKEMSSPKLSVESGN